LGIYEKWSQKKVERFINLSKEYTISETINIMNISESSARCKAMNLGITFKRATVLWTEEKNDILNEMWGNKPVEQIAKKVGGTVSAVLKQAGKLGLGPSKEAGIEYINLKTVAELFGVSKETVARNWGKKGLTIKKIKLCEK
jgi:hypothetical protein